MTDPSAPIHIAHVLYRFAIGGLENGVVNLINRLDPERYRHAIVCLDDYDAAFAERIASPDVELYSLHKREGQDPMLWWNIFRLFHRIGPDIVHTRNFVALETQMAALAAGVQGRVHGEHGWDVQDLHGGRKRYRLARRLLGFGVQRFIALSRHLEDYLVDCAGIPRSKVVQIYNGVDEARYRPARSRENRDHVVIGTVGRMKEVKNQTLLVSAFIDLVRRRPELRNSVRLKLVGSGPLLAECQTLLEHARLTDTADIVGDSDRIPEELQSMDLFVLPSLAEGISNTILEAMATGLPVVATAVGGNPELVVDGTTGTLVPAGDEAALCRAIEHYIDEPELRREHARRGRERVESSFSLDEMVRAYDDTYQFIAGRAGK